VVAFQAVSFGWLWLAARAHARSQFDGVPASIP
jgi:hypothetical protein